MARLYGVQVASFQFFRNSSVSGAADCSTPVRTDMALKKMSLGAMGGPFRKTNVECGNAQSNRASVDAPRTDNDGYINATHNRATVEVARKDDERQGGIDASDQRLKHREDVVGARKFK